MSNIRRQDCQMVYCLASPMGDGLNAVGPALPGRAVQFAQLVRASSLLRRLTSGLPSSSGYPPGDPAIDKVEITGREVLEAQQGDAEQLIGELSWMARYCCDRGDISTSVWLSNLSMDVRSQSSFLFDAGAVQSLSNPSRWVEDTQG